MRSWTVLLSTLVASACSAGSGVTDTVDDTSESTDRARSIPFEVTVGGEPVRCGADISPLGSSSATAQLADLRFYVHDLTLSGVTDDRVLLLDETPYQTLRLALLDFEDGTGGCQQGDAETHTAVTADLPDGDWDTLTFTVGIPFENNHVPPATVTGPQAAPGMPRNQRDGWFFLRADLQVNAVPRTLTPLVLSSGGCDGELATDAPTACSRPGRATISVPFDPQDPGTVVLKLDALVGGVNVVDDGGGPPGCTGDPADTFECGPLYDALGMSFITGSCVDDCAGQRVFTTVTNPG